MQEARGSGGKGRVAGHRVDGGVQDREAGERSEPGGRVVWGFGLILVYSCLEMGSFSLYHCTLAGVTGEGPSVPTSCLPSASRHEGRTQEPSSLQLFVRCFGRIMKSVSAIYPVCWVPDVSRVYCSSRI